MAQEATGSGFDFAVLPEEEPFDIVEGSEVETEETPQEPTSEPTPGPQSGAPDAEEPTEEAAPSPEGEPQAPEENVYLGRFRGVEALEEGYRHAEARMTQATQEAAEMRRHVESLQASYQEQNQLLEALAPIILQQQVEANPELGEQLQQTLRQQALVQQQQAPVLQQMEAMRQEREQEQEQLRIMMSVANWRSQHPDVAPGSEADQHLANAVQALDLDISEPASLDLALEASQNPALLNVLRVNPHWIEMDGGIDFAKSFIQQQASPAQPTPTPKPNGATPRQAFVETGGQGAPTGGAPGRQRDEFDEAIEAYNKERNSPLFQ